MEEQIRLQQETSESCAVSASSTGRSHFGSVEPTPVVENGEVKDLAVSPHNVAQDIIESFMVAANVAMAQFLKEKAPCPFVAWSGPRSAGWHSKHRRKVWLQTSIEPDPRSLSEFLDQRRAADPVHFPIFRSR